MLEIVPKSYLTLPHIKSRENGSVYKVNTLFGVLEEPYVVITARQDVGKRLTLDCVYQPATDRVAGDFGCLV